MQYPFVTIKKVIITLLAIFLLTSNLLFFFSSITQALISKYNGDSESETALICTMSCCIAKPSESCCCKPKTKNAVLDINTMASLLIANQLLISTEIHSTNNDSKITTANFSSDCPCSQISSIEQTKNIYIVELSINSFYNSLNFIKYNLYNLSFSNSFSSNYPSRAPPISPI